MKNKIEIIFETEEQRKEFCEWLSGSGEQDFYTWCDAIDKKCPHFDYNDGSFLKNNVIFIGNNVKQT